MIPELGKWYQNFNDFDRSFQLDTVIAERALIKLENVKRDK